MTFKSDRNRLSLGQVARQLGVNISTVWRWSMKGVRNVRLETYCIGGKRYTHSDAVNAFIEATTKASSAPLTNITARTSQRRERDIDTAERYLDSEN